jgi:hypothetical protein
MHRLRQIGATGSLGMACMRVLPVVQHASALRGAPRPRTTLAEDRQHDESSARGSAAICRPATGGSPIVPPADDLPDRKHDQDDNDILPEIRRGCLCQPISH